MAEFARAAGFQTRFVGYESTEADTVVRAVERENGTLLAKLEDSPFYPEGGGQVSDGGLVQTDSGRAQVVGVYRVGSDQALALEPLEGEPPAEGEAAHAVVERDVRLATMRNHTATHLLHAALRERLGSHVRQAGSYVGPDKLRFDFTHGERLSDAELRDVEERVNGWIAANRPVRAIETTLDEARSLGAMALFGEKYGDWVRMVEIEDVSRELCGGTHVASSAEVGLFHVTSETSSASNVRRIEAVTGAAATDLFEARTAALRELSAVLKAPEGELVRAAERLGKKVKELEKRSAASSAGGTSDDQLIETAAQVAGVAVVAARAEVADPRALRRDVGPGASEARRRGRSARGGGGRPPASGGERCSVSGGARRSRGGCRADGGGGGRRRRWRPGHDGSGRRPRPGGAGRGAEGGARGDRAGASVALGDGRSGAYGGWVGSVSAASAGRSAERRTSLASGAITLDLLGGGGVLGDT